MGYYANGGGALNIRKENFQCVVDAFNAKFENNWYGWKPVSTVEDAFSQMGFEIDFSKESGDMEWAWFPDEKWRGESEFLEMLAPFAEDGSILDFSGEDGAHWRISYKDHQFYETNGAVIYPGDPYWEEAEGSR